MKPFEIITACFLLFVLLGAVVLSSVLLGGYGLILSGAAVAALLGGSQDQNSQTDGPRA